MLIHRLIYLRGTRNTLTTLPVSICPRVEESFWLQLLLRLRLRSKILQNGLQNLNADHSHGAKLFNYFWFWTRFSTWSYKRMVFGKHVVYFIKITPYIPLFQWFLNLDFWKCFQIFLDILIRVDYVTTKLLLFKITPFVPLLTQMVYL